MLAFGIVSVVLSVLSYIGAAVYAYNQSGDAANPVPYLIWLATAICLIIAA